MNGKKAKPPVTTMILYAAAIIVTIMAIAFLINNAMVYDKLVEGYVGQGYTKEDVTSELFPNQLLPTIFQTVIYLGVAIMLWAAGLITKKLNIDIIKK
jgi:uncharacterized membrane protein SpoIIM required for sporulation